MGSWDLLSGFVAGRRSKWIVLVLTILLGSAVLAFAGTAKVSNDPVAGLPPGAESSRVAAALKDFPSGRTSPAVIVYARAEGKLSGADLTAIRTLSGRLTGLADGGQLPPPQVAGDGTAATVIVPLPGGAENRTFDGVRQVRAEVSRDLPGGLTAQVTGPAAFTTDLAGVFDGANVKLLLTTVGVVTLLLLITYRSPSLWLIPLAVVGFADQVTAGLIAILSRHTPLNVSGATTGIVEVLVFGAGTNYALLLISRYREELRHVEDRHEAMHRAVRRSGPAVAATAMTVSLSLASLVFAILPSDAGIGVGGAIGVLCAFLFTLTALPAALVACGRWVFWPRIPRAGQPDAPRSGFWASVGRGVAGRPRAILAGSLVLLAVLASGLAGVRFGLSQTEQFRTRAESIDGLKTLSAHFPAGQSDPTVIVTRAAAADRVRAVAAQTPGVAGTRITERSGDLARIDAVLTASPDTRASYDTIRALRDRLHAVDGSDAKVGGTVATNLDTRDAAARDQRVVIPIILAIVLCVLIILFRALIGPVLLVASVVASFFASLGASNFAFRHWFGFPALDVSVPLLAFLFLVALGVDYNIFLISRGREEAVRQGTRPGIITALAVTGGVITSAGILLAAVFAVLGVLPLITLTEIGIIVGFGVLLDTLAVRTLLVPAIVTILGRRFWWPGALSRADGEPTAAPATARYAQVGAPG